MAPSGIASVNKGPWLKDEYDRLREVIQSKDGSIYLATRNIKNYFFLISLLSKIITSDLSSFAASFV